MVYELLITADSRTTLVAEGTAIFDVEALRTIHFQEGQPCATWLFSQICEPAMGYRAQWCAECSRFNRRFPYGDTQKMRTS